MRLGFALLAVVFAPAPVAPAAAVPDTTATGATVQRADTASLAAAAGLLAEMVKAYGGRAALQKVHAYRMDGYVVAVAAGREGPTTRLYVHPGRLRVVLGYPGAPETRILDGARGWRASGDRCAPASGAMLDAMTLQATRAGVPWILMEHGSDLRSVVPREHRGRMLPGLELALGRGLALRVYLDPATHRVERSESWLSAEDSSATFVTVYGDYRPVKGIPFAFHEENFASGTHTGDITFDRVELNPPWKPTDFAPPPKKSSEI